MELEGARAELTTAQTEVAQLKKAFLKYREDALMEVSWLQARAEDAERKVAEIAGEIAAARTVALFEYHSLAEFKQVCANNFDEGVHTFIYNVWREHPEWDLSFIREAAREMIIEFDAPPETPLAYLLVEFIR